MRPLQRHVHTYLFAFITSGVFICLRLMLNPYLGTEAPLMLLVLGVFISAWYGGFGPGLFSTAISLIGGAYFFLKPYGSLVISNGPDAIRALIFLVEGITISHFCARLIQAQLTATHRQTNLERALLEVEQQKDALRLSEMKFRLLVDGVKHYGICLIDAQGRFASWNTGVEKVLGYKEEEWVGLPLASIFTPEDIANGIHTWELNEAEHKGMAPDYRWHVKKDGSYFWAMGSVHPLRNADGFLIGYAKVIGDYTAQKQIELALRAAEEKMRSIIDTIMDAIISIDNQGIIETVNPATARLFGYTADELQGQNVSILMPEPYRSEHDGYLDRYHQTGEHRVIGKGRELVGRRKDGSLFPIHLQIGEYLQNGQKKYSGIVHDITVRKEAELQLLGAKDAAEEANRAKSSFLANMSHEIRTPLGVILGFADLLQDPDVSAVERAKFVATIKRNGKVLARIIDDVLDLSKVEAGKLEVERIEVSIPHLVSDVVDLLEKSAQEKGLEIQVKSNGSIPQNIISDPTRLRQILINVIGNAIKFTSKGFIHLTVKMVQQGGDRNFISFAVQDTGRGIALDHQRLLFQAFSQGDRATTREFGGTGLGLVLSQRLARLLGGNVELTSSILGQGSIFTVTVATGPLMGVNFISEFSLKSVDVQPVRVAPPHKDALCGVKVLLVEDMRDNQILIKRFLNHSGVSVETAGDGFEGIDKALAGGFDVVLMDMQMPRLDGYEAASLLRRKGFKKPIIALTAHAMKEERDRSLEAGCNDHLTKPISPQMLVETIARYTDRVLH